MNEDLEAPAIVIPAEDELVPSPALSILDRLHAEGEEAAAEHTLDLRIPRFKSLYVRYRWVDPDTVMSMDARKYQGLQGAARGVVPAADTLVLLCKEFCALDADGELRPMHEFDEIDAAFPVQFDEQIREVLNLGATSAATKHKARQTVLDVYDNPYAVIDHARRLTNWLKDPTQDPTQELLGG